MPLAVKYSIVLLGLLGKPKIFLKKVVVCLWQTERLTSLVMQWPKLIPCMGYWVYPGWELDPHAIAKSASATAKDPVCCNKD